MIPFLSAVNEEPREERLLSEVYRRYRQPMFRYALRLTRDEADAEDVVHDVFLALVKNGAEKLRQADRDDHLWIYLAVAVRNRCVTLLEKRGREPLLDRAEEAQLAGRPAGDATEGESAYRFLVEAIRAMKPEYADALYYSLVREMSAPEIAVLLGLKPAAVRQRISRGKKLLKQRLGEDYRK